MGCSACIDKGAMEPSASLKLAACIACLLGIDTLNIAILVAILMQATSARSWVCWLMGISKICFSGESTRKN